MKTVVGRSVRNALNALLDDEASKLRIFDYLRKWLGGKSEEMPRWSRLGCSHPHKRDVSAFQPMTKDEARRIAANIAKCRGYCEKPRRSLSAPHSRKWEKCSKMVACFWIGPIGPFE